MNPLNHSPEENLNDRIDAMARHQPWIMRKFSRATLEGLFERWRSLVLERADQEGIEVDDDEVYRHLRASYLRSISSERKSAVLNNKVERAIDKIKRNLLLTHLGMAGRKEMLGWKVCGYSRLIERTALWDRKLKSAIPNLPDVEVFRYFRKRYLQVSDRRFRQREIPKGIYLTRERRNKLDTLQTLHIEEGHPQYDWWMGLAPWEFRRKIRPLERALQNARTFSIHFPAGKEGNTMRRYRRYLRLRVGGRMPSPVEETIYKLILAFGGMTDRQLAGFFEKELAAVDHDMVLEEIIARLMDFGLIEEQACEAGRHLKNAAVDTDQELLLESWLHDLRNTISIGTGEALSYLPPSSEQHSIKVIREQVLPRATERIRKDREKILKDLGIEPGDPRYGDMFKQKLSDLKMEKARIRKIIDEYRDSKLSIPEDFLKAQRLLDYQGEAELDLYALICHVGVTSYRQLARLYRIMNKGRIGFNLELSLSLLSSFGLLEETVDGLYRASRKAA